MSSEIIIEPYFRVRHKLKQKRNQDFKPLFFKISLHSVTSNPLSTCGELNLPLINIICWPSTSGNAMKTYTDHDILRTLFYPALKETTHKPLEVAAAKIFFSSMRVIDECFLFHVITGRHYFS